jgi:hypothetical protein
METTELNEATVGWRHFLLRDFEPYGIIFINVFYNCFHVFYGIMFMTMCVYYFRISRHS